MGPRFNGVEDATPVEEVPVAPMPPSMGPRFNGVEDSWLRVCRVLAGIPFNGATL